MKDAGFVEKMVGEEQEVRTDRSSSGFPGPAHTGMKGHALAASAQTRTSHAMANLKIRINQSIPIGKEVAGRVHGVNGQPKGRIARHRVD